MATVERAIAIAAEAHAGQVDKVGQSYILHPLRVMLAQTSNAARIVGVLHDVVEDTDYSLEDLRREGFGRGVLEALDAVTRRSEETYEEFIQRSASAGGIARSVKCADLLDNCDLSRIAEPSQKDYDRIARYRNMLETYFEKEAGNGPTSLNGYIRFSQSPDPL